MFFVRMGKRMIPPRLVSRFIRPISPILCTNNLSLIQIRAISSGINNSFRVAKCILESEIWSRIEDLNVLSNEQGFASYEWIIEYGSQKVLYLKYLHFLLSKLISTMLIRLLCLSISLLHILSQSRCSRTADEMHKFLM